MPLALLIVETLALLVGIVWVCSVFTNAIEWLGHRFNLSEGAVGSVLAAVGTALPETLVPLVAIIGGAVTAHAHPEQAAQASADAAHIGIGAILGAPFLLSTLAMGLAGAATLIFAARKIRGRVLHLDLHLFKRDLSYFFPAYALVYGATLISYAPIKWVLAAGLVSLYGVYVYRTLKIEHIPDAEFHIDPLMFAPKAAAPATGVIVFQTVFSLVGIVVLAHLFVQQISHLSALLQFSPMILSLLIAPIATELPEKFNSVVWISKKKDNLAMGNITGAMVFQSCIPTAIGLTMTPWVLDTPGLLSVWLCFLSAGFLFMAVSVRRLLTPTMLLAGGGFYIIFLAFILYQIKTGAL